MIQSHLTQIRMAALALVLSSSWNDCFKLVTRNIDRESPEFFLLFKCPEVDMLPVTTIGRSTNQLDASWPMVAGHMLPGQCCTSEFTPAHADLVQGPFTRVLLTLPNFRAELVMIYLTLCHVVSLLLTGVALAAPFNLAPVGGTSLFPFEQDILPSINITYKFIARCKLILSDAAWPSSGTWAAFNASVNGQLLRPAPAASPCHFGPYYNATRCSEISAAWDNSDFR